MLGAQQVFHYLKYPQLQSEAPTAKVNENKDNAEKSATDDFDNIFNDVKDVPVTVDLHPTG